MRILAVTNMYPTTKLPALGTFVERQIASLRRIGVEVDVVFADRRLEGMSTYIGLGSRVRVKAFATKPDLVHIMYGGIMADLVTRAVQDKPTIVTFHGSDLLGEHFSGSFRKLMAGFGVWASRRAALRASAIIVVSRSLAKALPKSIYPSKIKIVPCGIDLERFRILDQRVCRERLGWDSGSFHVLFPANTGSLVKRPALAQAAVRKLNSLGVSAEIHYLRGVPHSEVPIWINASDVFLLTSIHEGSPTIVKEALACNLPVVSVDVGDVRERIQDVKGCYIGAPDPDSLAAKLMLVHSGLRRVEGRSKVRACSIEQIALRLKSVYKEVIQPQDQEPVPGFKSVAGEQGLAS